MQSMTFAKFCAAMMLAITTSTGCVATATVRPPPPGYDEYARTGIVEAVRPVIQRVQGNPAGGAAAGALIGAVLFGGHGPRTLFGAVAGAATGAALSSGSYETRAYEVVVRLDSGERAVFTYRDYSPFAPGDRIELSDDGPHRVIY
jgi:outer membrane lipoprotein SlyB